MSNDYLSQDFFEEQLNETIERWEGTVIAKVLRRDRALQDWEAAAEHMKEARQQEAELDVSI